MEASHGLSGNGFDGAAFIPQLYPAGQDRVFAGYRDDFLISDWKAGRQRRKGTNDGISPGIWRVIHGPPRLMSQEPAAFGIA